MVVGWVIVNGGTDGVMLSRRMNLITFALSCSVADNLASDMSCLSIQFKLFEEKSNPS